MQSGNVEVSNVIDHAMYATCGRMVAAHGYMRPCDHTSTKTAETSVGGMQKMAYALLSSASVCIGSVTKSAKLGIILLRAKYVISSFYPVSDQANTSNHYNDFDPQSPAPQP